MDNGPNLGLILKRLHESVIAAGIDSSPQDGMRVWIGDDVRKIEMTTIHPVAAAGGRRWVHAGAATRRLIDAAVRLFPRSRFGLEHRTRG